MDSTIDRQVTVPSPPMSNGGHGPLTWPRQVDLFGVQVSVTDYAGMVAATVEAAARREPAVISLHSVHALITASRDPQLRARVNRFAAVCPDGQPVRWALNWLYRAGLHERVYGPELMIRLCAAAAERGVSIYLYGSTPAVIETLEANLRRRFPRLQIAGAESPPFRSLSAAEDEALIARVNESGAGLFFVGLGCPKQDFFASDHCPALRCVQVCVGAAFDFHAGNKRTAPSWMQRRGLEWLFRLWEEPRRLWKRYLVTNTIFLGKLVWATCQRRPVGKTNMGMPGSDMRV